MSKTLRATAVLAAAGLAVPLWAVPSAFAETSTEPAATGAYFYSAGIDKPEQSPTGVPNVTGDRTDGVAPEHLAVAVRAPGQVDKLSFLSFDLVEVPFDAVISKAVVTVPLAENGNGNMQMSPAAAKVRGCAAGDEGFNGEDAGNITNAPSVLCDEFEVLAQESADKKAYQFDVTALASTWLTAANNGMALTPAVTNSPFQVVFLPFAESSIAVEYTAASEDETFTEVFTPSAPLVPEAGTGFSGDTGTFDSGFSGGGTDSGAGFGAVAAPSIDTALPEPQTMEEAAPAPDVAPTAVRNVALAGDAPLTPTPAFWLGLLAAGALLALLGLIMGDPRVPATSAAGSQSRLSQALQQRQRADARGPRMARPLST